MNTYYIIGEMGEVEVMRHTLDTVKTEVGKRPSYTLLLDENGDIHLTHPTKEEYKIPLCYMSEICDMFRILCKEQDNIRGKIKVFKEEAKI